MKNNKKQKNIPCGWSNKYLGDMFDIKRGGSPRPIDKYLTEDEDGLNWLMIGDIDKGAKYITKTSKKIIKEGAKKTTLVKKGDFILSNSMSFGRPYILDIDTCIHDGWLTFQNIKTDILNRNYLYYLLLSSKTQAEFLSVSAGSGVQNLKKETVSEISLLFPSLPEQKQIVKILETWDKCLEKLSRKIEVKKNIKKGIASQIMNCELLIVNGKKVYAPKVRLSGFGGEWESVKLGDICQRIRTGKLDANAMVENGKYRFYTCAKDFYKIDDYAFDTEALLISGNGANVGYIHYYKGKFNAYQRIYILDRFKNNIFFIKYILDKFLKQRIFAEKCDGNTPYIKMDTLTDMKIKIPKSQKEQTAIAKILTTADKEIEVLEKKKKIIEDQKKYLLNNLVTGKIRIPEFIK